MQVLTFEEQSFYFLIDEIIDKIEAKQGKTEPLWIGEEEAMSMLNIKSKTTLSKLRNNDEITFSQPRKKLILYHRGSLISYLEKHSNHHFSNSKI